MSVPFYAIHPARSCQSCAHVDPNIECLQLVSMAGGKPKPRGFGCPEHQTPGEFELGLHRFHHLPLFPTTEGLTK